ncbi:helix-turn-helix domain-containing protein [Paenibacillus tyrfis]|uniref:helix-turn-helix domain-containing protein n=1 Tax=Paenibacillus tyrfis TaxID=1501230 RepID=UPI0021662DEF|nr:helix-turn-helix transcriptional regulator [Paenibacillus tyrfis]
MKKIHSNLKNLIDAKGVSIRQVARDIDYRFDSVRLMYNDEMKQFPREFLEKLCTYFDVGIDELLRCEDERESE